MVFVQKWIDSSEQFNWYKPSNLKNDITDHFFKNEKEIAFTSFLISIAESDNHSIQSNVIYDHEFQFIDYKLIDYQTIQPFISKYFTPSDDILHILKTMETKYNLTSSSINNTKIYSYDNLCCLFYRGNDKNRETHICDYDDIISKAKQLLIQNPNIIFLIQSDETEFINKMLLEFPRSFFFKDEIRHINKCDNTVDIIYKDTNYEYSKFYFAITIIMSKCKYIICTSGNCSIWIMLYRNNANNVYQYLFNKWMN